jgi:hypothetical protein
MRLISAAISAGAGIDRGPASLAQGLWAVTLAIAAITTIGTLGALGATDTGTRRLIPTSVLTPLGWVDGAGRSAGRSSTSIRPARLVDGRLPGEARQTNFAMLARIIHLKLSLKVGKSSIDIVQCAVSRMLIKLHFASAPQAVPTEHVNHLDPIANAPHVQQVVQEPANSK